MASFYLITLAPASRGGCDGGRRVALRAHDGAVTEDELYDGEYIAFLSKKAFPATNGHG